MRLLRLVLLVTVCLALGACAPTVVEKDLKTGFAKYTANQPDEAFAIADQFIKAHPDAPTVDEAYYLRGLALMSRSNRNQAADDFKKAIAKTQRADLKGKAYRALGDIAGEQNQFAEAQKNYEASLATGAMSAANVTYLNFAIGSALQAQGQWDQAKPYFARVVAANNDADRYAKALARMNLTAFALQLGAFRDAANARSKVTQLAPAGVTASIVVDNRGDGLWYLVQSGAYRTWTQAAAVRDQVQAKLPDVVVIVP